MNDGEPSIQQSKEAIETALPIGAEGSQSEAAPSSAEQTTPSMQTTPNAEAQNTAVDPLLYDSVVNELVKAYPHLASNPMMLSSVAMQQTMVLQMFIANNANKGQGQLPSDIVSNQVAEMKSGDEKAETASSHVDPLGKVDQGLAGKSVSGLEVSGPKDVASGKDDTKARLPPGFTEHPDEVDAPIPINKSPQKKSMLSSLKVPCNPLGANNFVQKSKPTESVLDDKLEKPVKASGSNLSISEYAQLSVGKTETCYKEDKIERKMDQYLKTKETYAVGEKLEKKVDQYLKSDEVDDFDFEKKRVSVEKTKDIASSNSKESLNEQCTENRTNFLRHLPPRFQRQNSKDSSSVDSITDNKPVYGKLESFTLKGDGNSQAASRKVGGETLNQPGKQVTDWWGNESTLSGSQTPPYHDNLGSSLGSRSGGHVTEPLSHDFSKTGGKSKQTLRDLEESERACRSKTTGSKLDSNSGVRTQLSQATIGWH